MGYFFHFSWGGGQNFEFDIFGGFQKNDILLGMKFLWIFLGGRHKIGLYLGVISMHFRVFLFPEWGIFFVLLKFQKFFGVLEIPDIYFGVNGRC